MWRGFCSRAVTALILLSSAQIAQAELRDIAFNEIYYKGGGSGPRDWAEYKNFGQEAIDIRFWFVCHSRGEETICVSIGSQDILVGEDYIVEPGEIIAVNLGVPASSRFGELYLRGEGQIIDYVSYGGSQNFGRADEAVAAGLWTQFDEFVYDFLPTAEDHQSAAFCGVNSGGGHRTLSTDFQNQLPSMGVDHSCPPPIFSDGFESGDVSAWSFIITSEEGEEIVTF